MMSVLPSPLYSAVVACALAALTSSIAIASTSEYRPSLGRACDIYGSQRVRNGSLAEGPPVRRRKAARG